MISVTSMEEKYGSTLQTTSGSVHRRSKGDEAEEEEA